MRWRNTDYSYGMISIVLHWLVAAAVLALFALGLWMVQLNYYHSWYRDAPAIHKSVGMTLAAILILRLWWRWTNPKPRVQGTDLDSLAARVVHGLLYILLIGVLISGYLISTADGRPIDVFDVFRVPALLSGLPQQEDAAGLVHQILAYALVGLTALHSAAAFRHHFVDHDATLVRMLYPRAGPTLRSNTREN
jgi:cytochrome b561